MGFYIRKAFNFGPFRMNLSKKGIGTSVGVKGLRISTGAHGTELHAGRYGLYYREKLGGATEALDGDMPPVQTVTSENDMPPVQVASESGVGFALIILAALALGFITLIYFFG